jgi:hypothetical protein
MILKLQIPQICFVAEKMLASQESSRSWYNANVSFFTSLLELWEIHDIWHFKTYTFFIILLQATVDISIFIFTLKKIPKYLKFKECANAKHSKYVMHNAPCSEMLHLPSSNVCHAVWASLVNIFIFCNVAGGKHTLEGKLEASHKLLLLI